ncbi:MAG: cohesin domain-containing protein [Dehalococcoidia bacterium]
MTLRRAFGVAAVASAVTLGALLMAAGVGAGSSPTLLIDVGSPSGCVSVDVGDEVVVSLLVENVQDLQAFEATIVHDDGILKITAQDVRIFLNTAPNSSIIDASEPLPDGNGRHLLSAADYTDNSESGSGVLATITFEAIGTGQTTIAITQRDLNSDGHVDEGASLRAYGGIEISDFNGDGFFDGPVQSGAIAVGQACGAVPTDEPTDPPTGAPSPTVSPTASPTASATVTASPTGATSTPDGGTASVTASPTPVGELIWGDGNCSGGADPIDSLLTLRFDAGLSVETGACPGIGETIDGAVAALELWGDIDCSGAVNPIDSLKLLRVDAGLGIQQDAGCPLVGSEVQISL